MKLREMPNTVVHCKTEAEYRRVMELYDQFGWKWYMGPKATEHNAWKISQWDVHQDDYKLGLGIEIRNNFGFSCIDNYKSCRILSLYEFIREQGLVDQSDFKNGDIVEGDFPGRATVTGFKEDGWVKLDYGPVGWNPKFLRRVSEELKPGDWVEIIEKDWGMQVGDRYQVLEIEKSNVVLNTGDGPRKRGWVNETRFPGKQCMNFDLCKLRNCLPPQTGTLTIAKDEAGLDDAKVQKIDCTDVWMEFAPNAAKIYDELTRKKDPAWTASWFRWADSPTSSTAKADDTFTSFPNQPMVAFKSGDRITPTKTFVTNKGVTVRPGEIFIVSHENFACVRPADYPSTPKPNDWSLESKWVACHAEDKDNFVPFTSQSPSLIMKAYEAGVDAIEYIRLGADEKLLRECGYKNESGKWTELAQKVFLAELLRTQGEAVLLPLAKEIKKNQKDKKCCE